MESKQYVFRKYDIPPYILGGEVEKITDDGFVEIKGCDGYLFKPIKIVSLKEGLRLQKKIDKAYAKYREVTHNANKEFKEKLKKIGLKNS